jgi:hypothetical protein
MFNSMNLIKRKKNTTVPTIWLVSFWLVGGGFGTPPVNLRQIFGPTHTVSE